LLKSTSPVQTNPPILSGRGLLVGLLLVAIQLSVFPAPARGGWKDLPGGNARPTFKGATPGQESTLNPGPVEGGVVLSNLGLIEALTRAAVHSLADSLRLPPRTPVTLIATTFHEANWFVASRLAEELAERGYPVRISKSVMAPEEEAPPPGAGGHPAQGGNGHALGALANTQTPAVQSGQNQGLNTKAPGDTTGAYADSVALANRDPLWGDTTGTGETAEQPEGTTVEQPEVHQVTQGTIAEIDSLPSGEVIDLRLLEFGVGYSDVRRVLLFGPLRYVRVGGIYLQISQLNGTSRLVRQVITAQGHKIDRMSGSQRALAEGASYPFTPPVLKAPSLSRYIEPTVVVAIVSSLVYLFYTNQN
jgi:hypothetical protein